MSTPFGDRPFPRGPLIAIAALLVFSVLAVAIARISGYDPTQVPLVEAVASVELRFVDAADGAVAVYDAVDDQLVDTLPSDRNGFVRGVLRALARDRRARETDPDVPLRLARLSDGRLILEDLSNGQVVELRAFGETNAGVFQQLLMSAMADR